MMFTPKATKPLWMARRIGNGEAESERMIFKWRKSDGFTLIEMMIVISIIGILASIAMPNYQKYVIRARETSLRRSLFIFRDVIDQYYADHGKYPPILESLAEEKYLRKIPADPFTDSAATWITIEPEGDDSGGVYDIHSGSYKVSLSGTPYNEW